VITTSAKEIKTKKILLTPENTIVLRGKVDAGNIDNIIVQLLEKSFLLPAEAEINFVINSGGGSVFDGMRLLQVMEIIPQHINTISMFAFSMAYSISQRGDSRYITSYGTMGQHRAKVTLSGQVYDGELEARLKWIKDQIRSLSTYEASRMQISLKEFRALVKDELWATSEIALEKKMVDDIVSISCSKELIDKKIETSVFTPFGSIIQKYSACPLINGIYP